MKERDIQRNRKTVVEILRYYETCPRCGLDFTGTGYTRCANCDYLDLRIPVYELQEVS